MSTPEPRRPPAGGHGARALRRLWADLPIKNKLLTIFAIIILCVSLLSLYAHQEAYTFLDRFNRSLSGYYRINRLLAELADSTRFAEAYLKDLREEQLLLFYQNRDSLLRTLETVERESNTSLDTYFLLRAIRNASGVYFQECDRAFRSRQAEPTGYYTHFYSAQRIGRYIEGYLEELIDVRLQEGRWSYGRLVGRADRMRMLTLVGLVAVGLLGLAFGLLLSNHITGPIRKLAAASIHMAEGNLAVKAIESRSRDEVGVLATSFNLMSASIRQLVEDLREKAELEKRFHEEELKNMRMQQSLHEAQLLGLQSQINPHFLFNTLNTIARTSMFEHAPDTTRLIQSLANIFRYNLRGHGKTVSLEEELAMVREYMHIQQQRFGSRVRFELSCRLDPRTVRIPSLTLQPFVENAVIHGLEPLEEGGGLRLSIRARGSRVLIRIHDTGVGIPRERLRSLGCDRLGAGGLRGLGCDGLPPGPGDGEEGGGIGIANVARRLALCWGGRERLRICSRPAAGTLVTLSFPAMELKSDVQTAHRG